MLEAGAGGWGSAELWALRHHSVWWERKVLDVGKPELVRRSLGHRVLRLLDIQASLGVQMKGEWGWGVRAGDSI